MNGKSCYIDNSRKCPECNRFLGKNYHQDWCNNCKVSYPVNLEIKENMYWYWHVQQDEVSKPKS